MAQNDNKNKSQGGEGQTVVDNAQKVVSPVCRLSYVHAFKPQAMMENGRAVSDPKFSVSVLIPKSDTETVKKIQAAIEAAKQVGIKDKWNGKLPTKLKTPLRDGDTDRPDNDEYKGHWFLQATSKTKPGIIDRNKEKITDETEVYSGMWGRVSMNFYPFKVAGSAGVACGLNHIQKAKDDEPFGGRGSADEDFDELPDSDDDLLG